MSEFTDLDNWRAAGAEFIATLLFVFLGVGTVVVVTGRMGIDASTNGAGLIAIALAHGVAIMVLVAATARVSGGHINPAVTFGALITRKISLHKAVMYIAAQLVGAIVGVLLVAAVIPGAIDGALGSHSLAAGVNEGQGLLLEIVLTFALVFGIFMVAVLPARAASIAPLIIGLIVLVDHLFGVAITGASMNPARSFGPALIANEWGDQWVYWVGPLVGGGLAAIVAVVIFGKPGETASDD